MEVTTTDRLLTQDEAARLLGVGNPRTLAAWRLRRQGPPWVRVRSLIRYCASDLAAWIECNRVDPQAGAP